MPLDKHGRLNSLNAQEVRLNSLNAQEVTLQPHHKMRAAQGYSADWLPAVLSNQSCQSMPRNVLDSPTCQEQATDKLL